MAVSPGQLVKVRFSLSDPGTGKRADAVSLPVGVIILSGVEGAAVVVTKESDLGEYRAVGVVPSDAAGDDIFQIQITATVENSVNSEQVEATREIFVDSVKVARSTTATTPIPETMTAEESTKLSLARVSARIAEMLANPKPNYTIDGESYAWGDLLDKLYAMQKGLQENLSLLQGPAVFLGVGNT